MGKDERTSRGGHAVAAASHSIRGDIFFEEMGMLACSTSYKLASSLHIPERSWGDPQEAGGGLEGVGCNHTNPQSQAGSNTGENTYGYNATDWDILARNNQGKRDPR